MKWLLTDYSIQSISYIGKSWTSPGNPEGQEFNFNLYKIPHRLLCKRNDDEPVFLRTEPEKELDYIKDEIEMLQKIAVVAKQKLAKEDSSTEAEKGTKTKVKNAYLMKHQIQ